MQIIMFNDKCGLTAAVLEGIKTQTRRVAPDKLIQRAYDIAAARLEGRDYTDEELDRITDEALISLARYKVGEVVAIAQSYGAIIDELENPKNYYCAGDWEIGQDKVSDYIVWSRHPGFNNKMFIDPEKMPHQIQITNIRIEHLQDISQEDALKEGVYELNIDSFPKGYTFEGAKFVWADPRLAFKGLVGKTCGRTAWESNDIVFAYTFKLIR